MTGSVYRTTQDDSPDDLSPSTTRLIDVSEKLPTTTAIYVMFKARCYDERSSEKLFVIGLDFIVASR
jgi:hypothetical protein